MCEFLKETPLVGFGCFRHASRGGLQYIYVVTARCKFSDRVTKLVCHAHQGTAILPSAVIQPAPPSATATCHPPSIDPTANWTSAVMRLPFRRSSVSQQVSCLPFVHHSDLCFANLASMFHHDSTSHRCSTSCGPVWSLTPRKMKHWSLVFFSTG